MANASTGNIIFCDTAPTSYSIRNVRILGIIVHCTDSASPALVELGNDDSGRSYPTVVKFEVPGASLYTHLDLSDSPLIFPNGLRVKTLTDCTITLIFERNIENGG